MYLTRHAVGGSAQWAVDGSYLPPAVDLALLLQLEAAALEGVLAAAVTTDKADGPLLAPLEAHQEVWASGVTYLRSREARVVETQTKDIYEKVYEAHRAELFFKAGGWRVSGPGTPVRIRGDAHWNVPEPELTLVVNRHGEIVGYTVGNDMSSRDIEGENPLYLPQAKIYNGSCSLGPGIVLASAERQRALAIDLTIRRDGATVFAGSTNTDRMKRSLEELVGWLFAELDFPSGVLLMTGAGIVPPDDFSLQAGDVVRVAVADLVLENSVAG